MILRAIIDWLDGMRTPAPPVAADLVSPIAVVRAETWTVMDRDSWRAFLGTPLGRKIIARMRATEYVVAVKGAGDLMHSAHSAGLTVGYGQAITHLETLAVSAAQPAAEDQTAARTEETEHLELLGRLSP